MADRLTQLQDSLDDLLMNMFATLNYIQTRHPYGEISAQPSQAPGTDSDRNDSIQASKVITSNERAQSEAEQIIKTETTTPTPEIRDSFNSALRELARDLVMQEQKMEILINSLPGISSSEKDQEQRIRELEAELKHVEAERVRAEEEKASMLKALDGIITGLGRVR